MIWFAKCASTSQGIGRGLCVTLGAISPSGLDLGAMQLEQPGWLKAGKEEEGLAKKKRRGDEDLVAEAEDRATKGGKGVLVELVQVLAKLELTNSHLLADLAGTVWHTFLVDLEKSLVAKAGVEGGKEYDERVKVLKQQKEAGQEVDLASPGPPFLSVWCSVVKALAERGPEAERVVYANYWKEVVQVKDPVELQEQVKYFRVKKVQPPPKGGKKEKELVKIMFSFNCHDQWGKDIQAALIKQLVMEKAERKAGAAPRGPLEREAARLLEKSGKQGKAASSK